MGIKIKQIELGLPKQIGSEIMIRPIIISTTATNCNIYYEILTDNNQVILNGNLELSEDEYSAWGADNSYIDDLVINKLGLEHKEEEEE